MLANKRIAKSAPDAVSAIFMAIIFVSIAQNLQQYSSLILAVITLILAGRLMTRLLKKYWHRKHISIDQMEGLEFEDYIVQMLTQQGYTDVCLTEKYDYGIDIIAHKDKVRWGVQVKRYSGLVKANAVRQAVTALNYYDCDRAMVITNSRYSSVVVRLAESNNCKLIDGDIIKQWSR